MKRFLITGLGNPGAEYEETRHNIGFKVLDHLAGRFGTSFSTVRLGERAELRLRGRQLVLLKPNTFMNLSGKAVRFHLNALSLTPEQLLVVTDDVALPFAKVRLRGKGSDGGHNGMKSLIEQLGSGQFPRMRVGIGNDYPKGRQVDYVLGEWSSAEREALAGLLDKCADGIEKFALEGLASAMNFSNS